MVIQPTQSFPYEPSNLCPLFCPRKQLTLLLAFAAIFAASTEAGVVKRQTDNSRRIVRVRGRQREDRQLFFEPLPLAAPQPILIPSAAPLPQPIQLVEIRQQPIQPQPVAQVVEVREEAAATNYGSPVPEAIEVKEAEVNYGAPEVVEVPAEVIAVREEPLTGYGAAVRASYEAPLQPAPTQIVEVREPVFTVPQTIAAERLVPVKPIAITRRYELGLRGPTLVLGIVLVT